MALVTMTAPVVALKPCRLSNFPSSPWSPDATRSRQTCLSIPLTELNQYPPGKRGQEDKMYEAMECDVWWKTSYRRCKKVQQRQVLSATGYKLLAQLRIVSPSSVKSIVKYNTIYTIYILYAQPKQLCLPYRLPASHLTREWWSTSLYTQSK